VGRNKKDKDQKPQRSKGKKRFDRDKETLQELEEHGIKPSSRQRGRTRPDYNRMQEHEER